MKIQTSVNHLPDHVKTMAREKFLETINQEKHMSGDDLYWVLYRSAIEGKSVGDFFNRVESYLDAALGSDNYAITLTTNKNGGGGEYSIHGKQQDHITFWAGAAGVMPGCISDYALTCTLYQV